MSEESVGALFEYPYNQYLMTRLEFVLIANDELEAKIMRIIEVEMLKLKAIWQRSVLEAIENKQEPPPEPEEYWVTMSRGLFIAFLYKFDTSVVGAKHPNSISKSSLRRAIDDLIEVKQFLFSRAQPNNEFGPTQYTLNREVIQERMRNLPKHPMSLFLRGYSNLETGGVSNLETPTSQKGNTPVSNLEIPQFSNLRTLNNSNLDITNLDKDTYSDDVANANHHAPALSLEDQLEAARQLLLAHGQYPQEQASSELSTPVVDTPSENVENVEPTQQADIPTESKQAESYSQPTTPPETEKPARPARQRKPKEVKPEKPVPPPITLEGNEQAFYDLYCTMVKIPPAITEKVKEQCGQLSPHLKTIAQLYNLRNWMNKDKFYKGKGFRLGMLISALNDWDSKQGDSVPTAQERLEEKAIGFKQLSQAQLARLSIEDRREYARAFNAHLKAKKEEEQRQEVQQASSQKAG